MKQKSRRIPLPIFSMAALFASAVALNAQTNGTLTPLTTTYNYSAAPWVITGIPGAYPDGGGTVTVNPFFGATPGTAASSTTITMDVSPTLSQITYNSPYFVGFAAGTGTSIVAATTGLTLNAQLSSANTPTLFQLTNTISSPISGGGAAGLTKTGNGTVNLTAANTYTGGTHINGGLLEIGSTAAVGDGVFGAAGTDISFDGGALFTNVGGAGLTTARNVTIGAGGATIYTNTAAAFSGVISGAGSLTNAGFAAVNLTLTGANTYMGATINAQNVSAMVLSGNGSIAQSSSYDLTGSLTLTNTGTNVTNRLSDTAAVTLRGANVIDTGNATAASSETIGAVTLASSNNTILVTPGATASNSLTMASITRQNNATIGLRGTGLGGTPGNLVSNIYATTAPTLTGGAGAAGSTTMSILPYAYANSGASVAFTNAGLAGSSLVTYDVNGFRPLATAEYATAFGGSNLDNVRITVATAVPGAGVTANAVLLAPATAGASALSGGPINITSGAFLYSPTTSVTGTVSAALNFGTAEGVITNTSLLNLSSVISGSGGVTYTSPVSGTPSTATIALSGASTYTGDTTLNSGSLGFSGTVAAAGSPSVFGNSGTIVLAGGVNTASLAATATATLNRDISSVGSGINYVAGAGAGTSFTLNGNVSLTNNLYIYGNSNTAGAAFTFNGNISGTGGIIDTTVGYDVFNGNNTFSGGVTLPASSTFVAGSDTAFGTGPIYVTGAGTLQGAGTAARTLANPLFLTSTTASTFGGTAPLNFTGAVNLNGGRTVSFTNTAGTAFSGVMMNGALTKTGTGALALNSPIGSTYTGGTVLGNNVGALVVNNLTGSGTGTGAVSIGATSATTFSALAGDFEIAGATSIAGRLSPGNSGLTPATVGVGAIGTATFDSSLNLTSSTTSSVVLELGAGVSDKIEVGGLLTLNGTIFLNSLSGYTVQAGDTYDLADFGSITLGTFTLNIAGLTLAPGVTLDTSSFPTNGVVTAVPEPGTLSLLGAASLMAGIGILRRRRA